MFDYILRLQKKNYIVKYTVNDNNHIDMVFFCYELSVIKARRIPESIIIDATYKTNAHKLVFVNIVGTSSVMSKKKDSLSTFEIAGAWIMKKSSLIMNGCLTASRTRSGLPIYKKKFLFLQLLLQTMTEH